MTESEMVGWHHPLSGHEFEQTPGNSEGQGILVCCSSWVCKASDTTEQQTKEKPRNAMEVERVWLFLNI